MTKQTWAGKRGQETTDQAKGEKLKQNYFH